MPSSKHLSLQLPTLVRSTVPLRLLNRMSVKAETQTNQRTHSSPLCVILAWVSRSASSRLSTLIRARTTRKITEKAGRRRSSTFPPGETVVQPENQIKILGTSPEEPTRRSILGKQRSILQFLLPMSTKKHSHLLTRISAPGLAFASKTSSLGTLSTAV